MTAPWSPRKKRVRCGRYSAVAPPSGISIAAVKKLASPERRKQMADAIS
jgi:hypothetical protein